MKTLLTDTLLFIFLATAGTGLIAAYFDVLFI